MLTTSQLQRQRKILFTMIEVSTLILGSTLFANVYKLKLLNWNILTKPLAKQRFLELREKIGLKKIDSTQLNKFRGQRYWKQRKELVFREWNSRSGGVLVDLQQKQVNFYYIKKMVPSSKDTTKRRKSICVSSFLLPLCYVFFFHELIHEFS